MRAALELATHRIRAFHERQVEPDLDSSSTAFASSCASRRSRASGLYVPGGTARYPSSVLMTAIPAKVAGVREVVMVTPGASPEAMLAARLAGVDRVFELGGAQAIGALAYGTQTVPRVDKIVGPGNAWVASAKRQVYGEVDIDSIAGPSEVLIIADAAARPAWIAADLLAQAEHDREARAVLVTTSPELAAAVDAELVRQLADLPRKAIAEHAIRTHGGGDPRRFDRRRDRVREHVGARAPRAAGRRRARGRVALHDRRRDLRRRVVVRGRGRLPRRREPRAADRRRRALRLAARRARLPQADLARSSTRRAAALAHADVDRHARHRAKASTRTAARR